MAKLSEIKKVYSDTFFKSPNPNTPWVSIQLRDKIKGDATDSNYWRDLTFNPNNYFDSLTVEDMSGFQRITLRLFDKNFANLENAIVRAVLKTRLGNTLVKEGVSSKDDSGLFELKIDTNTSINMRIKFGYSDYPDGENFIRITDSDSDEYKNRANIDKTVLATPWIYFQILGVNFKVEQEGLYAEITAISMVDSFLSRAKLVRKFAILRGSPKNIMEAMKKVIENTSNGTLTIEYEDPEPLKNEDGTDYIDINFGTEENMGVKSWRSLKSIFYELCGKIPPRVYDTKDTKITEEEESEKTEKMSKSVRYSFMLTKDEDSEGLKYKIKFFYPDPINSSEQQQRMRTYFWRDKANSIVKQFSVESKMDWAAMNMQLLTVDTSTNPPSVYLNVATTQKDENASNDADKDDTTSNEKSSTHLGNIYNVTEALENFETAFVSDAAFVSGGRIPRTDIGTRVSEQFVHILNQGVYTGTISLPGDPFYLFDENLRPYEYMIRIVIMRPSYLDENGEFKSASSSYLTGYYAVKKITHTINASGFDTQLEIQRWPTNEG